MKEALENFASTEQLEGVTCTNTNQKVSAWRTMTLEKLPLVLVLQLQFFSYNSYGLRKILKTVDFPINLRVDASKLSNIVLPNDANKLN